MENLLKNVKNQKQFYKNKDGSDKVDKDGKKLIKKPLADSTLKTYGSNFATLAQGESLTDLKWLENVDGLMTKLLNKKFSDNTNKNYLNSIIVVLQANAPKISSLPKYMSLRDSLNKKYIKSNETGIVSDKQKDALISIQEFEKMLKDVNEEIKTATTKSKLKKLTQLSLILEIYKNFQLRNEVANLKIISNQDFKKLNKNQEFNYLVVWKTKMHMVFSVYKTAKIYGMKTFEVPVNIRKQIENWIENFNPNNRNLFIQVSGEPLNNNNMTKLLTAASKKYLDKKISTTMIRKIYSSDKFAIKNEEQQETADVMGHSVTTQNLIYVKKPQPKEKPKIVVKPLVIKNSPTKTIPFLKKPPKLPLKKPSVLKKPPPLKPKKTPIKTKKQIQIQFDKS